MEMTELEHVKVIRNDEEKNDAVLFEIDGDPYWIPRSQLLIIQEYPGLPIYWDIEIPVWLYETMF